MDKIKLTFDTNDTIKSAIESNADYIKAEVLALDIGFDKLPDNKGVLADLEEGDTRIDLVKE